MSSSIANSRLPLWTLPPALLLAAVCVLRPLESRLLPPVVLPSVELVGRGGTLAVLGGMRSVLAGGFWLRTNLAWERRDAAETLALLHLTVAADERPLYFWLNGARMIAYDFPAWRSENAPAAVRQRNTAVQAQAAIAFLEQGLRAHGPAAELTIEMANIRLRSLGDREGAARLFRQAAVQPGAPYYAARIHAELLRELGRSAEALAWLKQILPGLPADDPAAQRAVVLERIKGLEQEAAGK
jgi:tetratricopeptide (TPR) repeat protein